MKTEVKTTFTKKGEKRYLLTLPSDIMGSITFMYKNKQDAKDDLIKFKKLQKL